MMPEVNKSVRYRVNVSVSTKGQFTFDCTVDAEGFSMDDVLTQSDSFVRELTLRYPPEIPEPKVRKE